MEREKDMRRTMELTDPKYVWMTADTGHLVLGGGDPAKIISDYFPRIAEVHLKDTYAKYRGNTSTRPRRNTAWRAYITIWAVAAWTSRPSSRCCATSISRAGRFSNVDGPRKGDDGFDSIGGNLDLAVDDYIAHNINYLRNVLGVKLPPAV